MRRHIRLITLLSIATLVVTLVQSAPTTSSADDVSMYYASAGSTILPPPGEATDEGSSTFVLELTKDTDPAIIERAAQDLGAVPIYRTKLAYSGVAVSAPSALIHRLNTIPGVVAAHLLPSKQRLRTRAAITHIITVGTETPTTMNGRGVRIGIIDSGIDYTHATFGGPGTEAAYNAIDPTMIQPEVFPTTKVAGGYDFVGDNYDSDGLLGSPIPKPDPNPLDCRIPVTAGTLNRGGHGTHIAATISGYGIVDGHTYVGANSTTNDDAAKSLVSTTPITFELAPGIAPQSTLYAFKVFGCRGSTVFLSKAIEYAVDPNGDGNYDDRMVDVLNIAIGSPFGSDDDPDAQAVNKAVEAGVTVVVAVGDSGNTFYTASSPGSATGAITVGALDTTALASFSSRGPQRGMRAIKPDLVAPGTDIPSAAAGTGNAVVAMDGTSSAAAQVAGAAALILQQHQSWSPTQVKAALIGTATPLTNTVGLGYPASLAGAGKLNIPALKDIQTLAYVDGNPAPVSMSFGTPWLTSAWHDTRTLSIYNNESTSRTVQLNTTTTVSETGVSISIPKTVELLPKSITNVPVTMAVDPTQIEETPDFFTPDVQGILDRYALAEHSGFIKVSTPPRSRVRWAYVGNADLALYVDGERISDDLFTDPDNSAKLVVPGRHVISVLSEADTFGSVPPITQREVDIKPLTNYTFIVIGGQTVAYLAIVETPEPTTNNAFVRLMNTTPGLVDAYIDGNLVAANMSFLATAGPINIAVGSHTVEFFAAGSNPNSLPISKARIEPQSGSTFLVIAGQGERNCRNNICKPDEYGLVIMLWEGFPQSINLNVPFQIFPKSASLSHASTPEIPIRATQKTVSIPMQNTGARNKNDSPRGAQTPLVAAFELSITSPQSTNISSPLSAADIRYVGITSDYSNTVSVDNSWLYFATASYGPWSTPNEVQHRIYLDVTGPAGVPDGIDDYLLLNTSFGVVTSGQQTDTFVSLLYTIPASGPIEWAGALARYNALPSPNNSPFLDVAPYNSSVMFQQIRARSLGLSDAQPRLRYHIETRARDAGNFTQVIDRVPATGSLDYTINAAGVTPINSIRGVPNLFTRPLFLDTTNSQVLAAVRPDIIATRGSQGVLLLHLHNPLDSQAEVVTLYPAP